MNATIDPDAASQRVWDVVVVGAGPAGSMATLQFARRGASVLLVDRSVFPREKVCGCYLNAGALDALRRAEVLSVVEQSAPPTINGIRLRAGGAAAHLRLNGGVVMSRGRLDAGLIAAAIGAGAQFLPHARAVASDPAGSTRRLQLRVRGREYEVQCRLAIDASGVASLWTNDELIVSPRSYIGLSAIGPVPVHQYRYDSTMLDMACGSHGYVGGVLLEDGRMNVAAAICPQYMRRVGSAAAAVSAVLEDAGAAPLDGIEHWQWKGTRHLTARPRTIAGERLLAIGDAAGYIEPFTGEGIEWALQSAMLAEPLAAQAIAGWDDRIVAQWRSVHRDAFRWRHSRCRALTGALRWPLLARAAVGIARTAPAIGEAIGNAWHTRLPRTEATLVKGVR